MAAIELDLNPDRRKLRQFGWIALIGFGLLAALAWLEWAVFGFGLGAARGPVAGGFAALAGYALLAGLFYPPANRPLWVALMIVMFPIGFTLSYGIMGVLFFGIDPTVPCAPEDAFYDVTNLSDGPLNLTVTFDQPGFTAELIQEPSPLAPGATIEIAIDFNCGIPVPFAATAFNNWSTPDGLQSGVELVLLRSGSD